MPDYGHKLCVGVCVTPQSKQPHGVVDLAKLSEQVGLDLFTFPDVVADGFLDSWTLLAWIAASTTSLRVFPSDLDLRVRRPAVVARAAASLDALSRGRVELGVGMRESWDSVDAGLPEQDPVTAMRDAIDLMQSIWDVAPPTDVDFRSDSPFPPLHSIGIWVEATTQGALQMVGESADGWVASLAHFSRQQRIAAARAIDGAATTAGRDPGTVRRVLTIEGEIGAAAADRRRWSVDEWTDALTGLVVEEGFSAFVLRTDDRRLINILGQEVAPAIRAALERERRGRHEQEEIATPQAPRHLDPVAIRRDALPISLRSKAVLPGDETYSAVRSTFFRSGSPALVFRPETVDDVVAALAFARTQDVPLSIRSGGHGVSGRSTNDGGIVIDLAELNAIEIIDAASGRVRLGPGARWGDVAAALDPYGLAMTSGDHGGVGVGGIATAGGIGLLGRSRGLTIDHLVAAEVVLADGRVVRADTAGYPDLFWGLRGAGGNLGIATAFEFEAFRLGKVVISTMFYRGSVELLERWGDVIEAAPRELTSFVTLVSLRDGAPAVHIVSVYGSDDVRAALQALRPLTKLGRLLDEQTELVPYSAVVPSHGPALMVGYGPEPAFRSGLARSMTGPLTETIMDAAGSGIAPVWQARAMGGAINDVDPLATAFPHRDQNFSVIAGGLDLEGLNRHWDDGVAQHMEGAYSSFDSDPRPERLHDVFPGETFTRLQKVKAAYDPDQVFNQNHPIPAGSEDERVSAEQG